MENLMKMIESRIEAKENLIEMKKKMGEMFPKKDDDNSQTAHTIPLSKDERVRAANQLLSEIIYKGNVLSELFVFKEYSLCISMKYAIEQNNHLFFIESVRSYFEVMTTKIYLAYVSDETSDFLCLPKKEKEIFNKIEALKNHYETILYSSGNFKNKKYSHKNRKNKLKIINTIKYFKNYVPADFYQMLKENYGVLSEYTHPNLGSNLMVSNGKLERKAFALVTEEKKNTQINKIYKTGEMLLDMDRIINQTYEKSIMILNDLHKLSLKEDKPITKIFMLNELMEGTGESKEQAFYFPYARSHREAIQASRKYADENHLKDRQTHSDFNKRNPKEKWFYDVYKNPDGEEVWFKLKMDLEELELMVKEKFNR